MRGGPLKREALPIAVILCLLLAGLCQAERRTTKPQVNPEQAAATPPPTLEEMPATAPQVTFRDGQLTIAATNSTLADILKAVRTQTGAAVDVPGNPTERVVGQFGPGPARDVLASLLNGSHFNYVLLGSETNPNALDRVILMAKSGTMEQSSGGTSEQAYVPDRSGPLQPPMSAPGFASQTVTVQGQSPDSADADADSDDSQDADAEDATDDSDADQADQTDQAADQQGAAEGQDGQQNVKTPEQILQELQQQQQQNQQQPGVPPGAMPPGMIPHLPPGVQQPPH